MNVKLNKALAAKIKKCASAGGYSSPEEFVDHILEREIAKFDGSPSDEEIARKMQGLGYIDAGRDI